MLLRTLEEYILTFVLLCNSLFLEVKEGRQHNKTEGVEYMAVINFDGWFPRRSRCFVISNTGADTATMVTKDTFVNPPIKLMGITEANDSEILAHYSQDILSTPQAFNDSFVSILRGEVPGWRLISVDIDVDPGGVALWFGSNDPVIVASCKDDLAPMNFCTEEYALGTAILNAPAWSKGIEFEVCNYTGCLPTQYKLGMHMFNVPSIPRTLMAAYVVKFVGKQKIYELEMREDNHGHMQDTERQYYVGRLYS